MNKIYTEYTPSGISPGTLRNIFEILLNQTQIRLYLPFSDCFGLDTFVCCSKSIGKW